MGNILYYIALPFGWLMRFCCFISPGHNYLIALIFFTVIIQVLLCLIFGIKQQKNMQKQASMAPKAAAIRKKYAGRNDAETQRKMQEETMALYQEHGYSPMGGCLPMLIQLPIIMALYYVVVYPLQYICMLGQDVIEQMITDFKAAELLSETAVKALGDKFNIATTRAAQVEIINKISEWRAAGSDPSDAIAGIIPESMKTGMLPDYKVGFLDFSAPPPYPNAADFKTLWPLLAVPVLIVVTMIFSQILTRKFSYQDPTMQAQQNNCSMKAMMYSMPLLSAWISFSLPAAVGVYWIYRSVVATLQQFILSKLMPMPKFTEEDYKAAEKALAGTSKKKKKLSSGTGGYTGEKKRSLHHIDDEDDDAPAQEALKPADKDDAEEHKDSNDENSYIPDPADAPVIKDDKGSKKYKKKK